MRHNINRVQKYVENMVGMGDFLQSCFSWQSKIRSIIAFAVSYVTLCPYHQRTLTMALPGPG